MKLRYAMQLFKGLSTIIAILLVYAVQAQWHAATFDNLYFHHINANSNIQLHNPVIQLGFVSSNGILYYGGESGLYQFDGSTIKSYKNNDKNDLSICDNYITNIIEDKYQNFWIGTQNGISYFDRNKQEFKNYQKLITEVPIPPNFYAYPFYIDNNENVWVYISGNIFTLNPPSKKLTFITKFSNGRLYVNEPFYKSTFKVIGNKYAGFGELYIENGEKKFQAAYLNQVNDNNKCIVKRTLWLNDSTVYLSSNIGLIKFNTNTKNITVFKPSTYAKENDLSSIAKIKKFNNQLIIGSLNNGLYIFNTVTNQFTHHFEHDPLDPTSISGNNISDIVCDDDYNVFCIIPNIGISYFNLLQSQFDKQYLKKETAKYNFLNNKINAITKTEKASEILIGTNNNGVIVYDWLAKKIMQHIPINDGIKTVLKYNPSQYIAISNNNTVYQLTSSKNKYEFKKLILAKNGISYPEIILQDIKYIDKNILVATNYGLAHLEIISNTYSLKFYEKLNKEVHWNNFAQICPINEEKFLLQALSTNLYLISKQGETFVVVKEIARTPYQIFGSTQYKNKLAIATSIGLKFYNPQTQILEEDNYIKDYAVGVLNYNNTLWLTTKNGLIQYQPSNGSQFKFVKEDGIQDNVFNPNALIKVAERIVAGGENGLNVFNPKIIQNQIHQYTGIIKNLKVGNNNIPFQNLINNPKEVLDLHYHQNTITFDIAPLVYINNSATKVYYQMIGIDAERKIKIGYNTITYSNLKPGTYKFVVSGSKDYLNKTIHINIQSPYWQTWWFRTLAILILIIIIAISIWLLQFWNKKNRVRDLRIMITSQENERERIARDLHDLFGARLSTLKLYMQTINKNNPKSINTLTTSATTMIDNAISELRHLLFDLSPKTLTENGLIAAVEDLVDNLERITKLEVHLDFYTYNNQLSHKKELSIYRIIQELLNNTLKYANATIIHISLVKNGNEIVFMYEDNGIGFDADNIKLGYGLHNIELHTKAMFGTLTIESGINKGVQVIITLPLKD